MEIGKIINKMVREFLFIQMEKNIFVNGKIIKSKDSVLSFIQIGRNL
jgi:hypothetical protein